MELKDLFDPIIDGVQYVTYHRKPTREEIAFGYGATHYRDFPIFEVSTGRFHPWGAPVLKKWVLSDDGLRYYR